MKKITAILAAITISICLTMCKPTDTYIVTEDGWHIHNVPIDTNLKD
jgi:hypothetical protein